MESPVIFGEDDVLQCCGDGKSQNAGNLYMPWCGPKKPKKKKKNANILNYFLGWPTLAVFIMSFRHYSDLYIY